MLHRQSLKALFCIRLQLPCIVKRLPAGTHTLVNPFWFHHTKTEILSSNKHATLELKSLLIVTFFWQSAQTSVIFSTCCKLVIHVSTNGFKSAAWGDVSMMWRVTRLSLKGKLPAWLSYFFFFDIQDQNVWSAGFIMIIRSIFHNFFIQSHVVVQFKNIDTSMMHFSSPTPIRMNMSGTEAGVFGVFTFVFCSIKTKNTITKSTKKSGQNIELHTTVYNKLHWRKAT